MRISHNGSGFVTVFIFSIPFGSIYQASKIVPVSIWFRMNLIQMQWRVYKRFFTFTYPPDINIWLEPWVGSLRTFLMLFIWHPCIHLYIRSSLVVTTLLSDGQKGHFESAFFYILVLSVKYNLDCNFSIKSVDIDLECHSRFSCAYVGDVTCILCAGDVSNLSLHRYGTGKWAWPSHWPLPVRIKLLEIDVIWQKYRPFLCVT